MTMADLERYSECWRAALSRAVRARDLLQWERVEQRPRVVTYQSEEADLTAVKLVMQTHLHPEQVLGYLYSDWLQANDRLQPDIVESHQVLEEYADRQRLWIQRLKSPFWTVSARELLLFDSYLPSVHMSVSVTSGEYAESEDYLRAELLYGAHFVEETRSGTRLTAVALGDPKGWIPAFLVRWKITERGVFYEALLKDMEEKCYMHE